MEIIDVQIISIKGACISQISLYNLHLENNV
jgi:hypothetical protein